MDMHGRCITLHEAAHTQLLRMEMPCTARAATAWQRAAACHTRKRAVARGLPHLLNGLPRVLGHDAVQVGLVVHDLLGLRTVGWQARKEADHWQRGGLRSIKLAYMCMPAARNTQHGCHAELQQLDTRGECTGSAPSANPSAHLDLNVHRRAGGTTQRLVDHDARVRHRVALALRSRGW